MQQTRRAWAPARGYRLGFVAALLRVASGFFAVRPRLGSTPPVWGARLGSDEDAPLFSVPIPGSRTATLQIPGPARAQALAARFAQELVAVGPAAAAARAATGTAAVAAVARDALGEVWAARSRNGSTRSSAGVGGDAALERPLAPKLLRQLFERLGPVYVKLGQLVASSPSVFPAEYVDEFQACLDQSSTVPFAAVRASVERELGAPLEVLYQWVDAQPLASASVAQVHAATLWDGTDAVIKVLKPGVASALTVDLALLTLAADALEAVAPEAKRLAAADVANDLRESMVGELDLRSEANRMRTFQAFLDQSGLAKSVACPRPVRSLTSASVLTMTRLRGKPLVTQSPVTAASSDVAADDAADDVASASASSSAAALEAAVVVALGAWCRSVTECAFFHADVHGGNLLLLDDGRVAFLDWGIVGTLPSSVWSAAGDMRQGLASSDMAMVARSLVSMGVADGDRVDEGAFARDLGRLLGQSGSGLEPGGSRSVASGVGLVADVVAAAETHGLQLPKAFGLLAKQALYFDRYLQALAPGVDPFTDPRVSLFGSPSGPDGAGGPTEESAPSPTKGTAD